MTTKGDCVDHIQPLEQGGGQWDIKNLQTLCFRCHNTKTQMEKQLANIILVYGPPCSGKSTYISKNKNYDDIVLDIDDISEELYNTRQRTAQQKEEVINERESRLLSLLNKRVTIWIPTDPNLDDHTLVLRGGYESVRAAAFIKAKWTSQIDEIANDLMSDFVEISKGELVRVER